MRLPHNELVSSASIGSSMIANVLQVNSLISSNPMQLEVPSGEVGTMDHRIFRFPPDGSA